MTKRTSEIKNEVLNSRVSETKEPSYKNKKLAAFTLAEVLITLAIIGIVAALTIPTVINNYQKHAQYTAFMKAYNSITNALELIKTEYGTPDNWNLDSDNPDPGREKYFYPYFKYSTVCDSSVQDSCLSYSVTSLSGEQSFNLGEIGMDKAILLQDGSLLYVGFHGDNTLDLNIDTNGPKGPNVLGRDFFILEYENKNGTWGFDMDGDFDPDDCTSEGFGQGCAARLLQEGKMNY